MSGISLQEVGGDLVINVPEVQTSIGRGSFLQVSDKRVSRSHALLDVIDRKLYITPTHTNPCFLRAQNKDQRVLPKDVKQLLNHGDSFGLLPDQLFYKVLYPQVNGKEKAEEDHKHPHQKDIKSEEGNKNTSDAKEEIAKDADSVKDSVKQEDGEIPKQTKTATDGKKSNPDLAPSTPKKDVEESGDNEEDSEGEEPSTGSTSTPSKKGKMAMPLNKTRPLPDWMLKAVGGATSAKPKASPKKPLSVAVNKREPGTKLTKHKMNEEDDEEEDDDEGYVPSKARQTKVPKYSEEDEEDFEADFSDDDYVPEKKVTGKGRARRKRRDSFSQDDFSEDDDDYSPKMKKTKSPKKPVKGKGRGGKAKRSPTKTVRKTPQRSRRTKKSDDDDEDDDVPLPRRQYLDDDDDDDDSPSKSRPQRAARQKRGSYVDDPMIEEALEDFASDDDDVNEDKDSDFNVDGEEDSGSDWERRKTNSQKLKVSRTGSKARGAPRGSAKKGKKRRGRRLSKTKNYSDDDDDDDVLEPDEPYVPRPSKRRGGGLRHDSEDSDDDKKRKRRRERCQYGHKCYRKNAVHFRTYCHPGDSSYDDEKSDTGGTARDSSRKEKESRSSPDRPTRPQRSTAGTRLVTHGSVADDDLPDTYDYNDSFIDDGTQPTDDSGDDSDYNAEADVKSTCRDAKKFIKNKKMLKPVSKHTESD